ncbi:MAG: hypothetical protein E8D42_17385 [Nitrospira sp.]|nr:MAG: hypothetical protein E8D42_17385 [Nitrospira sp.]
MPTVCSVAGMTQQVLTHKEDFMERRMMVVVCTIALICQLGLAGTVTVAAGEEPTAGLNSPDAIKSVLEQQVGKRVRLKLESGQDLEGKVDKIGSHAVQLAELTGMEFFDATVKLDEIAAVIVKVRTK